MGRFAEPPDPVFHALNASIAFDRRLGAHDVRQSQAHVAMLARTGILTGEEAAALRDGLDRVATDMALFVRDEATEARRRLVDLMRALADLAERHADWPMPGYTHLQRAQPVYLAHHLLAYFWMFDRDARRFAVARESSALLPLGSGALAGLNWEIDRELVARELGFSEVAPNSVDAVS